jgi:signal transduction histidine kinase
VESRAFDPFFTTRSPQHVGLGLTTVHGFVTAHGGRAEIRKASDGGTVVTLRLPAEDAQ